MPRTSWALNPTVTACITAGWRSPRRRRGSGLWCCHLTRCSKGQRRTETTSTIPGRTNPFLAGKNKTCKEVEATCVFKISDCEPRPVVWEKGGHGFAPQFESPQEHKAEPCCPRPEPMLLGGGWGVAKASGQGGITLGSIRQVLRMERSWEAGAQSDSSDGQVDRCSGAPVNESGLGSRLSVLIFWAVAGTG